MKTKLKIVRCLKCKRGLLQISDGLLGGFEIKCPKCKEINVIVVTEGDSYRSIKTEK